MASAASSRSKSASTGGGGGADLAVTPAVTEFDAVGVAAVRAGGGATNVDVEACALLAEKLERAEKAAVGGCGGGGGGGGAAAMGSA